MSLKKSHSIFLLIGKKIVVGKVGIAVNGKPTLKTSPFEIDVKPRVAAKIICIR